MKIQQFQEKSSFIKNTGTFFAPIIQKKLSVGSAHDSYEVEADRVADKVMKIPEPSPQVTHSGALLQRKCAACEQEEKLQMKPLIETISPLLQRSSLESGGVAPNHVESQINSNRGGGNSMDNGTKNFMESRFGTDFSNIKIHTGTEAIQMSRDLNAQAFAVENDIYFNEGKYSPNSNSGKHLLAHELTHTVQQKNGNVLYRAIDPQMQPADFSNVTNECADALSKCSKVNDYCTKSFSKQSEKDKLLKKYKDMATSKSKDMPNAANNLKHYLEGSGSEFQLPEDYCKNESSTTDVIDYHRDKFIAGVNRRLREDKAGPYEMTYVSAGNGFGYSDFGLGVGGYTMGSKVVVSLVKSSDNKYEYQFDSWKVQLLDCYNWDPEKSVPLLADDKDACCLEIFGLGKHFITYSPVWTNTTSASNFMIENGDSKQGNDNPNEGSGRR